MKQIIGILILLLSLTVLAEENKPQTVEKIWFKKYIKTKMEGGNPDEGSRILFNIINMRLSKIETELNIDGSSLTYSGDDVGLRTYMRTVHLHKALLKNKTAEPNDIPSDGTVQQKDWRDRWNR